MNPWTEIAPGVLPRNPNACGGADVSRPSSPGTGMAEKTAPSASLMLSAVLTRKALPTSRLAPEVNSTPLGLMRKKLAFGIDAAGADEAVDCGLLSARYSTEDIGDRVGPEKGRAPACGHVEQTEAVEKIASSDRPPVDAVGVADPAHRGPQCSVGRDCRCLGGISGRAQQHTVVSASATIRRAASSPAM